MVAPSSHTLFSPLTMLRAHGGAKDNLCDRPVPSVINSASCSTSPYFLEATAICGNRRRSNTGESKSEAQTSQISMSDQRGFILADQFHPDPYTQSRTAEGTLNAAIVHAEIARSYEEYLQIFDAFYADDVEGSSDATKEPIRGKAGVRSLVFGFLLPLHAMAEIGGVSISVRQTPIPGDVVDETHSAWTLELVGVTGKVCTVNWRTFRKWSESRVVLEHHYDHQQSGDPLGEGDFGLNVLEPSTGFPKLS